MTVPLYDPRYGKLLSDSDCPVSQHVPIYNPNPDDEGAFRYGGFLSQGVKIPLSSILDGDFPVHSLIIQRSHGVSPFSERLREDQVQGPRCSGPRGAVFMTEDLAERGRVHVKHKKKHRWLSHDDHHSEP